MAELADFSYSRRQVRVVFEEGASRRLTDYLDQVQLDRAFLVCTPGRADSARTMAGAMSGRIAGTFEQAELHVPQRVVSDALAILARSGAQAIVALGGGSAIGLGKALARQTGLSLVALPTTYSGSEMTNIWGTTEGANKVTGRDDRAAAKLVVYDPELTYDLPWQVTGPSGMNAIAHAVEALYSDSASPPTSLMAAEGLGMMTTALEQLAGRPDDRAARRRALCAAHLCGTALDMTTMGLHHKLCHVLGGMLGLPHALTHAVILPYATGYNAAAAPEAMEIIATCLAGNDAAQGLWGLNHRLGIDQTLEDLGMTAADVEPVVTAVVAASYPNPAPISEESIRALLLRALAGEPPY